MSEIHLISLKCDKDSQLPKKVECLSGNIMCLLYNSQVMKGIPKRYSYM